MQTIPKCLPPPCPFQKCLSCDVLPEYQSSDIKTIDEHGDGAGVKEAAFSFQLPFPATLPSLKRLTDLK